MGELSFYGVEVGKIRRKVGGGNQAQGSFGGKFYFVV